MLIYHAGTLPLAILLLDMAALPVLGKFLLQRAVSLALLLGLVLEARRRAVALPPGSRYTFSLCALERAIAVPIPIFDFLDRGLLSPFGVDPCREDGERR